VALLGAACTHGSVGSLEVKASADIATVAQASWTDGGYPTRIEVSGPDGPWLATDWQPSNGEGHTVALLGLHAESDWTAIVATEAGPMSEAFAFSTGALPADFPAWTITGEPGWRGNLVTTVIGETSWVVVLDETGAVVWYLPVRSSGWLTRARVRQDGLGMRYGVSSLSNASLVPWVAATDWEGMETGALLLEGFTHDFVELPDGGVALLASEPRVLEGYALPVLGDRIVEMLADGTERTVFSTWEEWEAPAPGSVEEETGTWTHANALAYSAARNTYSLGLRNLDAIVEIDATTGALLRQVGGEGSTYAFVPPDAAPEDQHQFQWVEGGILVFDNRREEVGSRAIELRLDDEAGTATESGAWVHDPPAYVYALGDVHREADGSTLIAWSSAGMLTEYGSDGEVRWELQAQLGTALGFMDRVDALPGVSRVR
jgi:hypothetical protein